MRSIFQASAASPFHISVGAVLVNTEGKICVHKAEKAKVPTAFDMGGLDTAYILMRETLENGESLEEAVTRGIREEFSATGTIRKYLGSLQFTVSGESLTFQKTTLYFQIDMESQGARNMEDEESFTELVWMDPEELIAKIRAQGAVCTRNEYDESAIVEAYVRYR